MSSAFVLPGSKDDFRALPALPFSTNGNRFSDGISSQNAFDVKSPHFPVYQGPLEDTAHASHLHHHYLRVQESQVEQGIGGSNDGKAVQEVARLKVTSLPNYYQLPPPQKTFEVLANVKWNPSDFAIGEGETYNITVNMNDGCRWQDGSVTTDANGFDTYFDTVSNCHMVVGLENKCMSSLKFKRRLPSANWMSLACSVGDFVWPLTAVEPGNEQATTWMPIDEAQAQKTIFHVGSSHQFQAKYSGQLICFANDAFSGYWNNVGSLNVTVTRSSWPPKSLNANNSSDNNNNNNNNNTTTNQTQESPGSDSSDSSDANERNYYESRSLPACDSSFAVYRNYGNFTDGKKHSIRCNPDGGGSGWTVPPRSSTQQVLDFFD